MSGDDRTGELRATVEVDHQRWRDGTEIPT